MHLSRLLLAAAVPVLMAGCSPPATETSAPEPASATAEPATPAAVPVNDPALDTAVATAIGDMSEGTRTIVRSVGTGDQRLALVQLVGSNWCGSSGCTLLIFRPTDSGYKKVGRVVRVQNPVRVLNTTTNGLPDISITVVGGGDLTPFEAKLSFDGQAYPDYPSDTPLVGAAGTVVMTDDDMPPPSE